MTHSFPTLPPSDLVTTTAVAAATEQAANNVQTVASAAEELAASIQEISRQVAQSTKVASNAAEQARTTNGEVEALVDAAQRIGAVVHMIQDKIGRASWRESVVQYV